MYAQRHRVPRARNPEIELRNRIRYWRLQYSNANQRLAESIRYQEIAAEVASIGYCRAIYDQFKTAILSKCEDSTCPMTSAEGVDRAYEIFFSNPPLTLAVLRIRALYGKYSFLLHSLNEMETNYVDDIQANQFIDAMPETADPRDNAITRILRNNL